MGQTRKYLAYKIGVLFALLVHATVLLADDTEIFMLSSVGGDVSSIPKVMFNLEYTSTMASTICTNVDPNNIVGTCPGVAGVENFFTEWDLKDGVIDQFELTRAALTRVLAPLGGFELGMMMYNDDNIACAGPDSGKCSGGGYVFQKMIYMKPVDKSLDPTDPDDLAAILAADDNKREFFERLSALPSPQGDLSASAQHKELYFELFRYLTGQSVFNGHNGWNNLGTGPNSDYNLNDFTIVNSNGNVCCFSGDCDDPYAGAIYYSGGRCVVADSKYVGNFPVIPRAMVDGDTRANEAYRISSLPFMWDVNAESAGYYQSPLEDCSRVFVINLLNGGGTAQNDADAYIARSLAQGGMGFNPANNDPGFVEMVRWLFDKDLGDGTITNANGVLELVDKQNVTSYFIARQPQQLDAAAVAGGTGRALPLTGNAQAIVDAINAIFSDILVASSTYLAASIPVSSFDRGEMMDSTFMGVFELDEGLRPFWPGNIKKVKLDTYEICVSVDAISGDCLKYEKRLVLVDATGQPAFSDLDQLIRPDALTFWTRTSGYDLSDINESKGEVAGTDGRSVRRGGAGQRIPGFLDGAGNRGVVSWTNATGRKLFSDHNGQLIPLDWNNIGNLWDNLYKETNAHFWPATYNSAGEVTAMTGAWGHDSELYTQDPTVIAADCRDSFITAGSGSIACIDTHLFQIKHLAANLIAYIRGFDVMDGDGNGVKWESRRWLMGDVLHSRPTPLNYGVPDGTSYDAVTNPDIRLVFGSNDGFMRMLQNTNQDGSESGVEKWAYMPSEVMHNQIQLKYNAAGGTPIHPYGVDGPISFYLRDRDGSVGSEDDDKLLISFGLRRGGKALYGMDLTDPDNPAMEWIIDASKPGFGEMGYTFSQPVLRLLRWGVSDALRPVVIFGAGYDKDNKDTLPAGPVELGSNDSIGNAIYVVDAETGNLIWKVSGNAVMCGDNCQYHSGMNDSIPSDISVIADSTGAAYRAYVGDTGGNIWRVDLTDGNDETKSHHDASKWEAHLLLQLGRHASGDNEIRHDRRFFHAPDIVSARDELGRYIAVVIGSGNRAHPLQRVTADAMFMFKDRGPVNDPQSRHDLMDLTDNCLQTLPGGGYLNDPADCSDDREKLAKGWVVYFLSNINDYTTGYGEKSLGTPLTLLNTVYFSTYLPAGVLGNELSCGPALGNSYEYAISLSTAAAVIDFNVTNNRVEIIDGKEVLVTLDIEDRRKLSPRPGLPVPPVLVSYGGVISVLTSAGMEYVGTADAMKTYWFERNR